MLGLSKRVMILGVFFVVLIAVYKGSQYLISAYSAPLDIKIFLPGEEHIPFLPLLFIFYTFFYVMPCWLILSIKKRSVMFKILIVFGVALFVHLTFFLLFPIRYDFRPELSGQSYIMVEVYKFLYMIDEPLNTFPSMHVSFSILCYFLIRKFKPEWQRIFLILAISTSMSTVFIKQHFVADVIGGVALALALNYLVIRGFAKLGKVKAKLG